MKTIYSVNFGTTFVAIGSDKYNNYSIAEIKKMPFTGWINEHKKQYIDNCKKVIDCQMSGYNLQDIEYYKNFNFLLTKSYQLC